MNILPNVIAELLPLTAPLMAADGALILSGILCDQRDEVVSNATASGFALTEEKASGEWWGGRFTKQSSGLGRR